MAAGGFLLSEPWPNCPFENYKEIVLFSSPDELQKKIDYYLSHEDEREEIAKAGYHAVQKYTRKRWAEKILEYGSIK